MHERHSVKSKLQRVVSKQNIVEGGSYVTLQTRRKEIMLMNMYSILNLLYTSGAKSKLVALTLKDIHEAMLEEVEKISEKTVYKNIRKLSECGYIAEGLRHGNAKSFYVTAKGIDWMKELEAEVDE